MNVIRVSSQYSKPFEISIFVGKTINYYFIWVTDNFVLSVFGKSFGLNRLLWISNVNEVSHHYHILNLKAQITANRKLCQQEIFIQARSCL